MSDSPPPPPMRFTPGGEPPATPPPVYPSGMPFPGYPPPPGYPPAPPGYPPPGYVAHAAYPAAPPGYPPPPPAPWGPGQPAPTAPYAVYAPPSYPPPPGYWGPAPGWYAPPVPGPEPGVAYVKGGRRVGSWILDSVIVGVTGFVVIAALGFYESYETLTGSGEPLRAWGITSSGYLAIAALAFVYYSLCWWALGRTAGQALLRQRVVRSRDGGRIGFGQALIRGAWFFGPSLAGAASVLAGTLVGLVAIVGLGVCLADPRGQGWHDRLARTFLVRPLL